MDDCFGVEKLIELIFVKQFKITPEMTEPGFSYPAGLRVNNFPEKLHHVLFVRDLINHAKWINKFDSYTQDMLFTQESYLSKIILACYLDYYNHTKVFEGFISLCSFVRFFCFKTLEEKGINYFHLNSIIIMVFFEQVVKKSFLKCGGFKRLLKYIRDHRYHRWNWNLQEMGVLPDPSACLDAATEKNIEKEIIREGNAYKSLKIDRSVIQESTNYITQKVLSMLSVDLFSLEDCQDSNQTVGAIGLQDEAKTVDKKTQTQADPKPLKRVSKGSSLKKTVQADLKPLKEVSPESSLKKTVDGKTQTQADLKPLKEVSQESSLKKKVDEKTQTQADLKPLKKVSQESPFKKKFDENAQMQADLTILKEVSRGSSLKKTVEEKTKMQADLQPLKEVSQGSLNSYSNKILAAKQEDKAWYQSIVEAVTIHNQWKTASFETSDASTLKRAEKIQERVKDSIESLIKVLDEYEEE